MTESTMVWYGTDVFGDAVYAVRGKDGTAGVAADEYSPMPVAEVEACLEAVGLSEYGTRCEVRQRTVGRIKLEVSDGKITVTVDRPIRIVIETAEALSELQQILASMQEKGLKA